jgi:transposase-like protein
MKTKGIETRTRSVKQNYRIFTDEQRKDIINQIDNRPSNVSITEMFMKFGMGHGGNLYYTWRKKLGMRTNGRMNVKTNVSSVVPMNVRHSRQYPESFKRETIQNVERGREQGYSVEEMMSNLGLRKNLYYNWKNQLGIGNTKQPNKSENVKGVRKFHTVTLSIEVGSVMELINFCTDIVRIPKVKSVLSVE